MNKYVFAKIISIFIAAFSQIILKISANIQHSKKLNEFFNPYVIISYGFFFLSAILGVYSMKGISLSFSSIIESFSYVLIPFFSYLFLKEKMNKRQLIGTIIIFIGFVIYSL